MPMNMSENVCMFQVFENCGKYKMLGNVRECMEMFGNF